jgi:hypothetical protein
MPDGYVIIVAPDAPTVERDTLQCVHCGKHWMVVKGSGRTRGFCMKCNGVHCGGQQLLGVPSMGEGRERGEAVACG